MSDLSDLYNTLDIKSIKNRSNRTKEIIKVCFERFLLTADKGLFIEN